MLNQFLADYVFRRCFLDSSQPILGWSWNRACTGMNCRSQRVKPGNQRGCWCIKKFVGDAIHLRGSGGWGLCPISFVHDSFQRHATTRTAPGCDDDFRIESAISSAEHRAPGLPMNTPPAARTSSSTHGCEAMIGLPHSSQKTRLRGKSAVARRTHSISDCICGNYLSPRSLASTQAAMVAMSV